MFERLISVGGLVLLAACGIPHPPPAPPRQTNLDLKISGLALSNGLRVVLVRDPHAREVQVTMRYQVGSVDDPAGQAGMAHLVEHLMYQQVLGAQSLFAHLEDITTYFTGTTTFDATTFVARAQAGHLDEMLSIEAVRAGLRCTSITDSMFARERAVVVNELRQTDDATQVVTALHVGAYPVGHPYREPIRGTGESVGSITRDQACAFADAHYAPNNAVLVISGNITPDQVESSLRKFLARIPKRDAAPPSVVPPVESSARRVEVPAPIDADVVMVAWPLPADPLMRARMRAIAPAAAGLIDAQIKGRVALRELGDRRAPMIGIIVLPSTDETFADAIDGAQRGVESLPERFGNMQVLGELAFDRMQQTAIYGLFAALESDGDRDTQLASDVLAGRDPNESLAAEFQGLREMTRDNAAELARESLSFDRATIVVLKSTGKKRGHDVALDATIHDLGQRRDPPDPAAAHRPIGAEPADDGSQIKTRTLPNGLQVVLVPATSVPTVEVRLVFRSGTADEPADKHGAALVAADTLTWNLHYLNDLLLFAAAGGTDIVDVERDRTTFAAHGLDMHLDLLLAGLRRWIREGKYDSVLARVVTALRREGKKVDDDGALTDQWRAAMFGARHPYVAAGLVRHSSDALTAEDAARFRAAHYTPDNATLLITGHFDAVLADRWIDYLFADWTGHGAPRSSPRATLEPASIARLANLAQLQLLIALPATSGDRASQLVAAAMLDEIAADVRHQLGASYGLTAQLLESRLAAHYTISGWIDTVRSRDAIDLLRSRLAQLLSDNDVAARAFVTARARVLVHLASIAGSASTLAARIEHDVEMQRAPLSDLATAAAVRALTIDAMTATLADLDLSRAAVLMQGPPDEVDGAFRVLGRTPTYVHLTPRDRDRHDSTAGGAPPASEPDDFSISDLADALTEQHGSSSLQLAVEPGYSEGQILEHSVSGYAIAGEVGYRVDDNTAVGLHASIGKLRGRYTIGLVDHTIGVTPIDLYAFIQGTAFDRLWGSVLLGLHLDYVTDLGSSSDTGAGVAFDVGVDALKLGRHRLGVYGHAQGELIARSSYSAFTFGLAYRQ